MPPFDCRYGLLYERRWVMETIRQYFLTVIITAIICGIACNLLNRNKILFQICKGISGIALLLILVRPVCNLRIDSSAFSYNDITAEAKEIISEAQLLSRLKKSERIKCDVEQYILSKAKAMGAIIDVSVELDEENMCMPYAVKIAGTVSPYLRTQLTQLITDNLGIPKEAQEWTG